MDKMLERYSLLLKKNGVRNVDVARATGISTSTLSEWKNGKHKISASKIKLIADYFGVSIDYLQTGKENNVITINAPSLGISDGLKLEPSFRENVYNLLNDDHFYDNDEIDMIIACRKLNRKGREVLKGYSDFLLSKKEYTGGEELLAAHERNNASEEEKRKDIDIMKDENF